MLKRAVVVALIALSATGHATEFADAATAFRAGDFSRAATLWRQLAEIGNPAAQNNLGFMYEKGLGMRANPFVAADWYRAAAEQDDPEAQVNLGVLYVTGLGVPRDLVVAHKWFDQAAQAGSAKARQDLAKVVRLMTSDEFARARALQRASPAQIPTPSVPANERGRPPDPVVTKLSAPPTAALEPVADSWRVQVASLTTRQHAEDERRRLETLFKPPVRRQLAVMEAKLPTGTYYRVQITGLKGRAAATALCATLRQQSQDCFVVPQPNQPK